MRATTINMTTGNAVKHILIFSIPLLIGNIFQQFYNLADSIIVGKFINADALAAIGVTSSNTFLFFAICNGFASGGGILVSQSFGRGDTKEVKNYIANTGYIMILLPLFVGTLAFFLAGPILKMLDTPANIFGDARLYIRLMSIGLIFVSVYNYVSSILRALGASYFYVFLGMIYVVRGILNGLGDAFFALFNGIVEVIGRFTVPFILTAIPLFGLWGIWWSVGIVWFISGFTAWLRYLYKKKMLRKEER